MSRRSRPLLVRALPVVLSLSVPGLVNAQTLPTSASSATRASSTTSGGAEASSYDVAKMTQDLAASQPVDKRRGALKRLLELPPDATAELGDALTELRKSSPPFLAMLKSALGHAADPASGRAKAGDSFDLLEALLVLEAPDAKLYDPALRAVALMRALANMQTVPAARVVVENALQFNGALKIESARLVKSIGDPAVPALIEFKRGENRELRAWASLQMDALGKKMPGDAVQTKDHNVLAETLRAYGKTKDTDAIAVVLSFVNSDRAKVRQAAREATSAFGQDAIWKLREQYTTLTGKTLPDGTPAADVARELFAACDRFRLEEVYALVEEGQKQATQKNWKDATAAFDKALARQPTIDGRGEMVAAYVEYGRALEESDAPEALALFRKALRIDPRGHRAKMVEAEIAYLEGKALRASGLEDTEPFRRALSLDPSHENARKELEKLETVSEARSSLGYRGLLGAGIFVVAIGIIMLFGGARKRSASRDPTQAQNPPPYRR